MNRIVYFDYLKLFSVFGVILIHVTAPCYTCALDTNSMVTTYVVNAIGRSAVPVFLMISGALLLAKDKVDILPFYSKVFVRYLIPTLIWILIYKFAEFMVHGNNVYDFIYILKSKNPAYHLWYMWMFIGICAAYPFVYVMISASAKSMVTSFLVVCAIYSFLINPFTFFFNENIIQIFNIFFNEYLFYFAFGYALSMRSRMDRKALPYLFLLYAASTVAIGLLSFYLEQETHVFAEYPPSPRSLLVCIQAVCVFLGAKILFNEAKQTNMLTRISSAFYGIFFIHVLFLRGVDLKSCAHLEGFFPLLAYYLLLSMVTFLVSFVAVYFSKKVIFVKYLFP